MIRHIRVGLVTHPDSSRCIRVSLLSLSWTMPNSGLLEDAFAPAVLHQTRRERVLASGGQPGPLDLSNHLLRQVRSQMERPSEREIVCVSALYIGRIKKRKGDKELS